MNRDKICAVIVTHNRLALLKECLASIRHQNRPVDEIVVVNNGSSDGTKEWLAENADVVTINQHDAGSAGGQNVGIREAYNRGHDWFWCMDDDTIPQPDTLEKFVASHVYASPKTGFIHSVAHYPDGRMNAQEFIGKMRAKADRGVFPIPNGDWVSILIRREAVQTVGLPFREFFIDWCDVEYTQRILDGGFLGYCALESNVLHKQPLKQVNAGPLSSWETTRFYCATRNTLVTFRLRRNHGPLGRLLRCGWATGRCLRAIASRRVPVKTIKAVYEGLTWYPTAEFPG